MPAESRPGSNVGVCVLVAALLASGGWLAYYAARKSPQPETAADKPLGAFQAEAKSALPGCVIVPALNTAMPVGKSVMWCSSFQIAWNKMKNDVIKEPIALIGAEEVAAALNNAPQGEQDLPAGSYYAAAGAIKDGIAETIRKEMAQRFPGARPPTFLSEKAAPQTEPFLAYAFLAVGMKFTKLFDDQPDGINFRDSANKETRVKAFGFSAHRPNSEELAEQTHVLWLKNSQSPGGVDEVVVDVCRDSQPVQLVLAILKPKPTLAETVKYVQDRAAGSSSDPKLEILRIPNMLWRVDHHFSELEGRYLQKPTFRSYFIFNAEQDTEFRLDRGGAQVISEARLEIKAADKNAPLELIFDRPFLLYMKKRDAAQPFFVMWVDNAGVLTAK
ncbi:MAG TPA: hypothetical protein VGP72_31015 [Planctomycetota bacterium]